MLILEGPMTPQLEERDFPPGTLGIIDCTVVLNAEITTQKQITDRIAIHLITKNYAISFCNFECHLRFFQDTTHTKSPELATKALSCPELIYF